MYMASWVRLSNLTCRNHTFTVLFNAIRNISNFNWIPTEFQHNSAHFYIQLTNLNWFSIASKKNWFSDLKNLKSIKFFSFEQNFDKFHTNCWALQRSWVFPRSDRAGISSSNQLLESPSQINCSITIAQDRDASNPRQCFLQSLNEQSHPNVRRRYWDYHS